MRKYTEWRDLNQIDEFVAGPVDRATGSIEQPGDEMPTEEDKAFYQTKISSKLNRVLGWMTTALGAQSLTLVKKGFILERIIQALGFNSPQQAMRIVTNIKNTMQKADAQPQNMTPTQSMASTQAQPAPVNSAMGSVSGTQV